MEKWLLLLLDSVACWTSSWRSGQSIARFHVVRVRWSSSACSRERRGGPAEGQSGAVVVVAVGMVNNRKALSPARLE